MNAGYYRITTADNGKVLGFPLFGSFGNTNDFTGATATLQLRDQNGTLYSRTLVWNPTPPSPAAAPEWEYSVIGGEFPAGRYWAMVAVTWPGPVGPIYSTEVIFDVISAE